ncbi:hypothetical protein MRX96_020540 [Rhipicephalus microplus]
MYKSLSQFSVELRIMIALIQIDGVMARWRGPHKWRPTCKWLRLASWIDAAWNRLPEDTEWLNIASTGSVGRGAMHSLRPIARLGKLWFRLQTTDVCRHPRFGGNVHHRKTRLEATLLPTKRLQLRRYQ